MTGETVRVKRWENGRLAWYRQDADPAWWDAHWRDRLNRLFYAPYEQGHLGPFEGAFTRHLPRAGRVLEAGCGPGQYVVALRARGYEVEGVEWGSETVARALSFYPDLPVRCGDVTSLPVPDGHYAGYVSLGVMEHRFHGPDTLLTEARRVLCASGVAFIAVPFVHRLRRLKSFLGLYRSSARGLRFYQYAFRKEEFGRMLESAGFRVLERIPYDGIGGLTDEVPLLRRLFQGTGIGKRVARSLALSPWCDRCFGHMILFVCRKAECSGPEASVGTRASNQKASDRA